MAKADRIKARLGLDNSPLSNITGEPPNIPDHELIRCVGYGSYGEVWLARSSVGTLRAVKVIYRKTFKDERPYEREFSGIQRFEPLSRTHDGLVDVLQIGRNNADGYFYYVMELADNAGPETGSVDATSAYEPRTLGADLRQRRYLMVEECIDLGLALTLALGHLHRHGLIHRDVKPSNIIFVQGVPKLADIGLVIGLQEANSFVGTEGFVPPEGPNSPQADLYALGKVLYEASTGKDRQEFPEPFTALGNDEASKALMEFNSVLLKACARNVEDRYDSAEAMHADLAVLRSGRSVRRMHATERRLAQLKRVSVVFALVTCLATTGFWFQSRQARRFARLSSENIKLADEATKNSRTSRAHLAQLQTVQGLNAMEAKDYSTALLWFADILKNAEPGSEAEKLQRDRIGTIIQNFPLPQRAFRDLEWERLGTITPGGDKIIIFSSVGGFDRFTIRNLETGAMLHQIETTNSVGYAISPSGRWMLRSDGDHFVLWDIPAGAAASQKLKFKIPRNVAFSPDEQRIALTDEKSEDGKNQTVYLLEMPSGRPVATLRHSEPVRFTLFSPDSRWLATGAGPESEKPLDSHGSARIWNARDGEPSSEWLNNRFAAYVGAFSPDGRLLATSGERSFNTLTKGGYFWAALWDVKTGTKVAISATHSAPIQDLTFSPDGKVLATSGADQVVHLLDWRTGSRVCPPLEHESAVQRVVFSPDGRHVATLDQSVHLWNAKNGEIEIRNLEPRANRSKPSFSLDSSKLVTGAASGLVHVWNLSALGPEQAPFRLQNAEPLTGGAFSADEKYFAAIDNFGRIEVWDVLTRGVLASLGQHNVEGNILHTVQFSKDGSRLLGTGARSAIVWDWKTGNIVCELKHNGSITAAKYSPDSTHIGTGSDDCTAKIWNSSNGLCIAVIQHKGMVGSIAFSHDSRYVVIGSRDATAQVCTTETGTPVIPPLRHEEAVYSVAFDSKATRVATGSQDSTASIWSIETGKMVVGPLHHGNAVVAVEFSPDGQVLATAAMDNTVSLWHSSTGKLLVEKIKLQDVPSHFSFSRDGRKLVISSMDGILRVWSGLTGEPISPVLRHRWNISEALFWAGSEKLVSLSWDGTARIWETPSVSWPIEHISMLANVYSGRTLDSGGTTQVIDWTELERMSRRLYALHPEHFGESPEQLNRWHGGQVIDSEVVQDWFAAQFHLEILKKLQPTNPVISEATARVAACQPIPREPATRPELIDLSSFYTTSLFENWMGFHSGTDFAELPTGVQKFAGTEFDVRGAIRFAEGDRLPSARFVNSRSLRIPIGRKARHVHFLHGSTDAWDDKGLQIGSYSIHMKNAQTRELPLTYGEELRDCYTHTDVEPESVTRAEIAWKGQNEESRRKGSALILYKYTWDNQTPEDEIESITFTTDRAEARPFLVALTLE